MSAKGAPDRDDTQEFPARRGRLAGLAFDLAAFAVLLLVWEGVVRLFRVPEIVVPAPSSIVSALVSIVASGAVFPHLGITLSEVLLGFAIGSCVAD